MRIGIDLGGTSVSMGIIDNDCNVTHRASARTQDCKTESELLERIIGCIIGLLEKAGVDKSEVESIGIGSPGVVDFATGRVIRAGNLPLRNSPVGERISEAIGCKVFVENDANCAAWGEYKAGVGKDVEGDLVMVTIGTGVGGGIIVGGRILHGVDNCAGEIGHMVVDKDGKRCACGRVGCWETIASARALVAKVKAESEQVPYSILSDVIRENNGVADGRTLFFALNRGCPVAKSIFRQYIEVLSVGVQNLIWVLRPALIVFGGGISKEGETLIAPLRELIGEEKTVLAASSLNDNAGIIGAALLYTLRQ